MIPRVHAVALIVPLLCSGCGDQTAAHPAIGRSVGSLPLVSVADPGRASPELAGRITLLNFWATWCPPCRRELPGLVRLASRLATEPRFQLIAVACDQQEPDELAPYVSRFLAGQRIELEAWIDPDSALQTLFAEQYGFGSLPTTYLINADGCVQRVWVGYRSRDEADMARTILAALKDASAETPASATAR
jgi:cytochrome c biogenesis protein CcmG/thiol:disulfide interchange protein DsbE